MSSRQVDEAVAFGGRVIGVSDYVSKPWLRPCLFIKGHLVVLKTHKGCIGPIGPINYQTLAPIKSGGSRTRPYIELPNGRIGDFDRHGKAGAFDGDLYRVAFGQRRRRQDGEQG